MVMLRSSYLPLLVLVAACRATASAPMTHEPQPPESGAVTAMAVGVVDAASPRSFADAAQSPETSFGPRTLPLKTKNGFVRLGGSSEFPAVNKEGTEVALLIHDNHSFINAPSEGVIFFDTATGKRVINATIYSRTEDSDSETPAQLADLRKKSAASVDTITKRLTASTWRTLEASSDDDEYGRMVGDGGFQLFARFGSDLDIGVVESPARASLVPLTIHATRRRDGGSAHAQVRATIPQYGSPGMSAGRGAKGACGWLSSMDGWTDPERRFVVIHLQAGAGGDSCAINGDSDRTILVPLPR